MTLRVLAVVALVATAALAVPALDAAKPESCRPGVVFQNNDVRVWFHGSKGFVKVFDTNGSDDSGGSYFAYKTGSLVERDASTNATLQTMNLERAFPQSSGCTIERSGEWVNMTLTVTQAPTTVTFAYHFNTSSRGAKFDVAVAGWPWLSSSSQLAYAFDVEAGGNGTLVPASNGIGYQDANGTPKSYVEWAQNATATYADGHQETATVESSVTNSTSEAHVVLAFTNATAGYARLDYDPWVGSGAFLVVGGELVGLAPVEDALPGASGLVGRLL